ncbi:hypothetical protein FKR81_27295 [Lentzea tibetensis]|uniref:Lipoprotein n=1 Tax=Lentzea tibetensis TaxID=2591470 RepID=A0A563ENM6_9PSEU|nr:hypothetical protein [Lentzea tibetensis]TWP48634.1 hypothetical protein FKR81_27295 [Lentzea tibetensis]
MKFVKGSLLLAGAAVLLTACSVTAAPPAAKDVPVGVPTVSVGPVPTSSAPDPTDAKPNGARTVDVAIIKGIHKGARVTWVAGKIVKAEVNNVNVVPVDGAQEETAEISADATFFDPLECEKGQGLKLDAEGLGALECSSEEYQNLSGHYGTRIVINERGQVVKMADRYHP